MKHTIIIIMMIIGSITSYAQNNPTTTNCKDKKIERLRKLCICKDIGKYTNAQYNSKLVSSYAQHGANKIYTRFSINDQGQITNIQVKGSAYELEQEAIRTLQSFPDIIPTNTPFIETDNIFTVLIEFELQNSLTDL